MVLDPLAKMKQTFSGDAGLDYDELEFMDPDERREVLEDADWIRMSLIFKRRIQRMKSNIEMKMELMERRQCVIL